MWITYATKDMEFDLFGIMVIEETSCFYLIMKCPATPISVPNITDIKTIGGTDFLSSLETIIISGRASANVITPPLSHHVISSRSILKIINGMIK